ncbi:MAG: MFS transporter [bacterium]
MRGLYEGGKLPARLKAIYASGEFASSIVFGALSLVFASYFLIEVAGLRPLLAGLVPLAGRGLDAFTDPLMGRISDGTRWKSGRRRPYFLIGALPFGLSFALLWTDPGQIPEAGRFAYYTLAYCLMTTSSTVLVIPYMALQAEMATGYHERNSINGYRSAAGMVGVMAAVGMRPLAEVFGGGGEGFARAGMLLGVVLTLPWFAAYRVSFERPSFGNRRVQLGLVEGFRVLGRHANFRRLVGLYLSGRVAIDLCSAMLVIYCTYWLGQTERFEQFMLVFLLAVVASMPLLLKIAGRRNKASMFTWAAIWWALVQSLLVLAQPDWPAWVMFVHAPLLAFGFAATEFLPWSMVGDVVDEDDLLTGERREGLYNGVFTFLRKLSGALAVFLALGLLDFAGLEAGRQQQPQTLWAVRLLTGVGPGIFLLLAAWFARGYTISQAAHEDLVQKLRARDGQPGRGGVDSVQ